MLLQLLFFRNGQALIVIDQAKWDGHLTCLSYFGLCSVRPAVLKTALWIMAHMAVEDGATMPEPIFVVEKLCADMDTVTLQVSTYGHIVFWLLNQVLF